MEICNLCPRKCNADRKNSFGYCKVKSTITLGRAGLHFWEEPCISGTGGSGAIFFSGCNMGCIFCQNEIISHGKLGKEISVKRLREIFYELIDEGADNINLVTPSHYVPEIIKALTEEKLPVPVIYNTSSYEEVDTIKSLEGLIDIYLPDLKYMQSGLARAFSNAENYTEKAISAIQEMYRQVGNAQFDEYDMMTQGMIIRHLVLPGYLENTYDVIDFVKDNYPKDVPFSLMAQYTPPKKALPFLDLNRTLTIEEYNKVIDYMYLVGLDNGYIQDLSSATSQYTPDFNLDGV